MVNYCLYNFCNKNSEVISISKNDLENVNIVLSEFGYSLEPTTTDLKLFNCKDSTLIDGDLIYSINKILLNKFGFYLVINTNITQEKKDFKVLNEEILFKHMSNEEKINKINDYIKEALIKTENREELIIIDSYLFCKPYTDYEEYQSMLIELLQKLNFKQIIAINNTKNNSYCNDLKETIEKNLPDDSTLKEISCNKIHDRFLIVNRNKGIVIGTSLNSFGNKMFYMNHLDDIDTETILNYLYENNIIQAIEQKP
ncbi:MAG: hypothetical protein IJ583_02210 [Firmicutes bacterium]|nr:hypothetical protein [Bacillota bacterium]